MRTALVSYFQLNRFVRFDGKSMNRASMTFGVVAHGQGPATGRDSCC